MIDPSDSPPEYRRLVEEIASTQPRLVLDLDRSTPAFVGDFVVRDGDTVLDTYELEIVLPDEEGGVPKVRETGGLIPRREDMHMGLDGVACVVFPPEFWLEYPDGLPLEKFMEGPLLYYLTAQSIAVRSGEWPGRALGHGALGEREFLEEVLGTDNLREAVGWSKILSRNAVKDHQRCPCNSGKTVRRCHIAKLHELRRRVPQSVATRWFHWFGNRLIQEKQKRTSRKG